MIEAADCGGRITSKRGKDKTVARYFLMSQNYRPKDVMRIVRTHWTIENGLHWPLDVVLDEDLARNRKDNAPANLAVLRRLAVCTENLIRIDCVTESPNV